jgi:hypothetical protein
VDDPLVLLLHLPLGVRTGFYPLLFVKAMQGFGIGGEWAAGAVLMAETINPKYRGKVMGHRAERLGRGLGPGGRPVHPDLFAGAG